MKAVMWTDTFQMMVIIFGGIIVIIKGTVEVGGLSTAWDIAKRGDRIKFFEYVFQLSVATVSMGVYVMRHVV